MGTRGKIVDVIHHLSPKVPIIFLRYFTLDVEFLLRYDARLSPNIFVTINEVKLAISTNLFCSQTPLRIRSDSHAAGI